MLAPSKPGGLKPHPGFRATTVGRFVLLDPPQPEALPAAACPAPGAGGLPPRRGSSKTPRKKVIPKGGCHRLIRGIGLAIDPPPRDAAALLQGHCSPQASDDAPRTERPARDSPPAPARVVSIYTAGACNSITSTRSHGACAAIPPILHGHTDCSSDMFPKRADSMAIRGAAPIVVAPADVFLWPILYRLERALFVGGGSWPTLPGEVRPTPTKLGGRGRTPSRRTNDT